MIATARGTISTNTDTAVIAAPGAGKQVYIYWMTITVSAAGTTSRLVVEAGEGGAPLARMATVTADALLNINYTSSGRNWPGNPIGVNTALNIETSGSAAATVDYDIAYEIKGGS